MSSAPFQQELFTHPTGPSGTVFVNDRVCVQTEEDQRVLTVHGVVFSHYPINDRTAEAYAMVLLFESGYADQNDIARCFGYSVRSLRRYQERLKAGGLSALARPRGRPSGHKKTPERDQTILRLKTKGMSNRWIAGRLGLSETAIRKSLRRLGWKSDSDPEPDLPFLPEVVSQAKHATANKSIEIPSLVVDQAPRKTAPLQIDAASNTLDANPLDRSMDRLLAAMGLLQDALPLFAPARSLPRAGVLLAIPALVASGLLSNRAGWSPKLFRDLLAMGFDILTYRKGRTRHIAEKRFTWQKARLDGRQVRYLLHDQPVRFLKGKLRLRQVTRLTETGHQTPIVTSRWDLRAIVVAHRMFERWRQENFFKYLREEYLIDALADYQVEPDDPNRSVPNPARKAVEKEIHTARVHLRKLRQRYGAMAIDYVHRRTRTVAAFKSAEEKIRREIDKTTVRIKKLKVRRDSLPARVPLADARKDQKLVKLSTERKHLTNVLKMVAYQIESDLVELVRPYYRRVEDEGRTLIQSALQDAADIEPTDDQLRITLAPLSSPHRSRVLEALCEMLNKTNTLFPGTQLRMRYSVAPPQLEAKSGQISF
jgi:transposase